MRSFAMSVYDFSAKRLDGREQSLADYRGQVLLIVNTASQCGFTPQYAGLEALYEKLHGQGLTVLGFPCNQFGAQEPGDESQIGAFCERNYGVTFPIFGKIEVNGPGAHPLYKYLKDMRPGLLGSEAIKWNFTKFLVGRDGEPVARYAPQTKPEDIEKPIRALL